MAIKRVTDRKRLGKPIEEYPQNQEEMSEYEENYVYNPEEGQWYEPKDVGQANVEDVEDTTSPPEVKYGGDETLDSATEGLFKNTADYRKYLKRELAETEEEEERAREKLGAEEGEGLYEAFTSWAEEAFPVSRKEEKLEEAKARYETGEWLDKVQNQAVKVAQVRSDMRRLRVDREEDLEGAEQRLASKGAVEAEKSRLNLEYDRKRARKSVELGAEAALLKAYQGNLNEANKMVNDVVDAYTFDLRQERAKYDTLLSTYSGWVSSLDQEKQDLIKEARDDLKAQEENQRENMRYKMNLITDAAAQGVDLSLDEIGDMSLEEATREYGKRVSASVREEREEEGEEGLGAEGEPAPEYRSLAQKYLDQYGSIEKLPYSVTQQTGLYNEIVWLAGEDEEKEKEADWINTQESFNAGEKLSKSGLETLQRRVELAGGLPEGVKDFKNKIVAQITADRSEEELRLIFRTGRKGGLTKEQLRQSVIFSKIEKPYSALKALGDEFNWPAAYRKVAPGESKASARKKFRETMGEVAKWTPPGWFHPEQQEFYAETTVGGLQATLGDIREGIKKFFSR